MDFPGTVEHGQITISPLRSTEISSQMNRKSFLKRAGAGSVAAASFPALFGAQAAFAGASNGHRFFFFVAFSQAPAMGAVLPRIGAQGGGTFDPDAGWVKGGGTYVLFDQNTPGVPKQILATGEWEPTTIVSYDTKGLGSYALIQPAILTVEADWEGIGSGLMMEMVCNVGPAGSSPARRRAGSSTHRSTASSSR
jgi:hypothetical protein